MYTLMSGSKEVLNFKVEKTFVTEVEIVNKELAPEILKSGLTGAIERWLADRSVDLTRTNARVLVKNMGVPNSPTEIVLKNRALSLTDVFWVRHKEEEKFKDFCLYKRESNNYVVNTVLKGVVGKLPKMPNPELTNIGSFDKAWVKEKGKWYLVKSGDDKSKYAELFTYKLGKYLGLEMAEYEIKDKYLDSLNFTNERRVLEHYATYRHRFDDIDIDELTIYRNLSKVGLGRDYLNILFLDAVVCNVDRHEFNFGVIKESTSGKLLGLAPNYDNNLALGGISNPSLMGLKMHLKDFPITEGQKEMIGKLTIEKIEEIDSYVRERVDPENLSREQVLEYFTDIIGIFRRQEDSICKGTKSTW